MSSASRRNNDIDVVERCYALGADERTWLHEVADALDGAFNTGCGVAAYTYDASAPVERWVEHVATSGAVAAGTEDVLRAVFAGGEGSLIQRLVARHASIALLPPVSTISALLGEPFTNDADGQRMSATLGIQDVVTVNGTDGSGRGVFFHFCSARDVQIHTETARRLAQVVAHAAAGQRLRRRLRRRAEEPRAVVTPDGRVVHVTPEVEPHLEVLRRTAERLRMRDRRSSTNAERLDAWQALTSGRWSMIDRWEENGRRYLVAYENPPSVMDPRRLTPNERAVTQLASAGHSSKLVGYELGLSVGTVTSTLARVMRKLGVRNRAELTRFVRELHRAEIAERTDVADGIVVIATPRAAHAPDKLTAAERAVMQDLVEGRSNAEIAARRGSSVRTVAKQVASVLRKASVGSRAELVATYGT